MRLVKIGVAAVSVKVGDFKGNAKRIVEVIDEARAQGVHLLVTPELCISGYSLKDRIWWPDIARRSWATLQSIAEQCQGISVWVGLPIHMNSLMYNATALIHDGEILGLITKQNLPQYDIFYEGRNWTPGTNEWNEYQGVPTGNLVFKLPFGKISAEICEDLWSTRSPAPIRARAGAEIICNGSASPFTPLKNEHRKRLVQSAAGRLNCVYAFSNMLGLDNSRLVFDGSGLIATGQDILVDAPLMSRKNWALNTGVVDLDQVSRERAENSTWREADALFIDEEPPYEVVPEHGGDFVPAPIEEYVTQMPHSFFEAEATEPQNQAHQYLDELYDALVLGLRDYFEKVGAFDRFLVALSGGRDSALCLLIAVEAAKAVKEETDVENYADRINAVYLPNKAFSSDATQNAARGLAEELGVPFKVVSISEEADIALDKAAELAGGPENVTPLAKQNLQARVRGAMMLNWGNNVGGLLLVTSNLSEAAVGYTTTGGDNQGGYSPIANLPKTLVTRLLDYIAERDGIKSMQRVLDIPPSAELAEDQEDEQDLMPYVILDDLLHLFAQRRMALSDCWRVLCYRHPGVDNNTLREYTARFGTLFAYSQWKREQLPVALKVLDLDLDPKSGFRFPVTQSIEDELEELNAAAL
ncbi:MAG: NAD(+) synthase [Candidatus Hydrogenedentota bacterium]